MKTKHLGDEVIMTVDLAVAAFRGVVGRLLLRVAKRLLEDSLAPLRDGEL